MEIAPAVPASQEGGDGDVITASADPVLNPASSSSPSSPAENQTKNNTKSKYDDEEDEDVCRICRNTGDPDNPLRYPCACSGSIKFVHQDCLLQWLNHSNARQCEGIDPNYFCRSFSQEGFTGLQATSIVKAHATIFPPLGMREPRLMMTKRRVYLPPISLKWPPIFNLPNPKPVTTDQQMPPSPISRPPLLIQAKPTSPPSLATLAKPSYRRQHCPTPHPCHAFLTLTTGIGLIGIEFTREMVARVEMVVRMSLAWVGAADQRWRPVLKKWWKLCYLEPSGTRIKNSNVVCKHAFSFSPVYAANAPVRLPFQEFVVGMAMKACHVLQFFLRLSFVLTVWLIVIPFITFWIWRLAFVRSFGEAQRLFLSHISTTVILTDCLHGFLLSASIVFIFLGATSLRDYFRHLREIGGQDADREGEGDRNGARAARRPPGQVNRNIAGDGNGEDGGGGQGIAGAGQIIRRNAENVAARWEMQAARLEAQVEQMFDGLEDADGAEDVPFDELVGMQGPVFHLVENAFTVLASNMIFLGIVIFVPFSLGRIILHYASWVLSSATSPVLSTVMPFTESALSLANITLKNALTAVANLTSDNQESSLIGQVAEMVTANSTGPHEVSNNLRTPLTDEIMNEASAGASRLSDVTTLAVGYTFIFSLVILYLGIVALVRYTKGEPLTIGRFYDIASISETIPSLFRQFVAAMRHLMTMVKVSFLLVIELGVFSSDVRMVAGYLYHQDVWEVNCSKRIVYMLQISIFVSLLRGVLRNGVLYFLRDPADPNYNPFRDLIDDPVHKHARRVLLSVAVYGSLIVMLVFLPVKLAMRVAPSMFPLDISVSDPFTEVPADMLVFQICIPYAIKHFKLRATIKSVLRYWFTAVGWALGLTDFLLPKPEDNGGQENENGEPARQDRPRVQLGGQDRVLGALLAPDDLNRGRHVLANSNLAEEDDGDEQSDSERYGFVLRIVLLLMVAWMTLLIVNSSLIVVPISLGRALFKAIPVLPITHGIKCNDFYSFVIGSYVIWSAVAGASSALLSIWVFVIPVLIGLLFDLLVIVPLRVPVDESPVFLLYQDWALGLVFLKIWTRLVMMDHMGPLVAESWRIKFERVREDGGEATGLLDAARDLFGYPLVVNSAVYRFAWLGCFGFSLLCFCAKRFHVWFTNLHNSIRDDRYLIGRRLHNFGEDSGERRNEAANGASEAQNSDTRGTELIQYDHEVDVGLRLRHAHRLEA
ncbi:RING/U-box superfamily protein [Actinidia rufa]|uniref:RING-type E3 ubiquitin transferase n=1 Tax=Actinidia rufa TaxID=165716 RepID=A0A7J0D8M4_9ERIC|nr:RING/U-box superfamily protein [Actinidia rufa]